MSKTGWKRRWARIVVVLLIVNSSFLLAAQAEWSAETQSRMTYTDDVFQFSASRRQKFNEDPSQPTVVPTEKRSDVVWDPSLKLIRSSSNSLGHAQLSIKAPGFLYTANPVFNHGDYRLQLKQGLSHQGAAEFRYVLSSAAVVTLGVQRTQRSSTNEARSFQDTQLWIGGQYRF